MKAYLDCYPCFFKQILRTCREVTADEKKIREVLTAFGRYLSHIPSDAAPPEIGRELYRLISEKTGISDPYRKLKKKSTRQALALYSVLKRRIADSGDRLLAAARLAIAGNVIDFGTSAQFDLETEMDAFLSRELAIDHGLEFRRALEGSRRILYLADNAGETVFDRMLIEEIGKPVVYAVREKPIINDAVLQDALEAGLDRVAGIVSSGTDAPGTMLGLCSKEFLAIFDSADLIISKGQGNYEGLSDERRPVFFLLKAKCEVIARDIGIEQGGLILMKAKNFRFLPQKDSSSF
jgi:uncharacterized protein with ATP-grasp and redox domains